MSITNNFKSVSKGELPDKSMFVPIFKWFSGYEKNIEAIQKINKRFSKTATEILMSQLVLNNKLTHFISYPPPKASKPNKEEFFIEDLCKYFGWTKRELSKTCINVNEYKELIAKLFAYDDAQRKVIGLKRVKK